MKIKAHIFRAYDIRGIYGVDLDEEVAELVGKALGVYLGGVGKRAAVGYDVRKSSRSLKDALITGLRDVGVDVYDVGLVPTPTVYFTISHYNLDGGAIVSASHNPPEWNGFKLCRERSMLCGWGLGLEKIKALAEKGEFEAAPKGRVEDWNDKVFKAYQDFVLSKVKISKKLLVLADMGNGSCSGFADKILEKAGLEVEAINNYYDGTFPSRSPEPTEASLKHLKEPAMSGRYDFVVAYDGDGDRAVFLDDKGRTVEGDKMLAIFVRHFVKSPGEKIVYEVSCSKLVDDVIKEKDAKTVMSKVGHTFVLEKMVKENALIGGETSSHLYFRETYGADEAIFATLKVAQLLSEIGVKFSSLVDALPKYFTKRKVFTVPEEVKFEVIERLESKLVSQGYKTTTLDGVRVDLDKGWFIIRASNTLPQIKTTTEATDQQTLEQLENFVVKMITETVNEVRGHPIDDPVPYKNVNAA